MHPKSSSISSEEGKISEFYVENSAPAKRTKNCGNTITQITHTRQTRELLDPINLQVE